MTSADSAPDANVRSSTSRISRARFGLAILLLVLIAGGIRYAAFAATYPVELLGDELYYASVASQIARGEGHFHPQSNSYAWRPPAHSFALSRTASEIIPFGPATLLSFTRPLIASQIIWGTLLVGLTACFASLLFDRASGLVAGSLAAIYPPFIAHSHYLWSEMFFSCWLTAGLCLGVWARGRRGFTVAGAVGLVFGLAMLGREVAGFAAAVTAVWWIGCASRGPERVHQIRRAAVLLLCAGLVVLPWTIRNYRALGSFVPVATVGWYAAAEGNSLDEPDWLASIGARGFEFRRKYFAIPDEVERSRFSRQWAAERIAAEQPTWIFKKFARGVTQFFSPESYLLYKIERGSYRDLSLGSVRFALLASTSLYLAVLSLAILGVGLAARRERWLLLLLLCGVLFVHTLANSGVRFRVPWMPIAIAFASFAVVHGRQRWKNFERRQWIASAIALLVLFGACVPYYAAKAAALWRYGSGALHH